MVSFSTHAGTEYVEKGADHGHLAERRQASEHTEANATLHHHISADDDGNADLSPSEIDFSGTKISEYSVSDSYAENLFSTSSENLEVESTILARARTNSFTAVPSHTSAQEPGFSDDNDVGDAGIYCLPSHTAQISDAPESSADYRNDSALDFAFGFDAFLHSELFGFGRQPSFARCDKTHDPVDRVQTGSRARDATAQLSPEAASSSIAVRERDANNASTKVSCSPQLITLSYDQRASKRAGSMECSLPLSAGSRHACKQHPDDLTRNLLKDEMLYFYVALENDTADATARSRGHANNVVSTEPPAFAHDMCPATSELTVPTVAPLPFVRDHKSHAHAEEASSEDYNSRCAGSAAFSPRASEHAAQGKPPRAPLASSRVAKRDALSAPEGTRSPSLSRLTLLAERKGTPTMTRRSPFASFGETASALPARTTLPDEKKSSDVYMDTKWFRWIASGSPPSLSSSRQLPLCAEEKKTNSPHGSVLGARKRADQAINDKVGPSNNFRTSDEDRESIRERAISAPCSCGAKGTLRPGKCGKITPALTLPSTAGCIHQTILESATFFPDKHCCLRFFDWNSVGHGGGYELFAIGRNGGIDEKMSPSIDLDFGSGANVTLKDKIISPIAGGFEPKKPVAEARTTATRDSSAFVPQPNANPITQGMLSREYPSMKSGDYAFSETFPDLCSCAEASIARPLLLHDDPVADRSPLAKAAANVRDQESLKTTHLVQEKSSTLAPNSLHTDALTPLKRNGRKNNETDASFETAVAKDSRATDNSVDLFAAQQDGKRGCATAIGFDVLITAEHPYPRRRLNEFKLGGYFMNNFSRSNSSLSIRNSTNDSYMNVHNACASATGSRVTAHGEIEGRKERIRQYLESRRARKLLQAEEEARQKRINELNMQSTVPASCSLEASQESKSSMPRTSHSDSVDARERMHKRCGAGDSATGAPRSLTTVTKASIATRAVTDSTAASAVRAADAKGPSKAGAARVCSRVVHAVNSVNGDRATREENANSSTTVKLAAAGRPLKSTVNVQPPAAKPSRMCNRRVNRIQRVVVSVGAYAVGNDHRVRLELLSDDTLRVSAPKSPPRFYNVDEFFQFDHKHNEDAENLHLRSNTLQRLCNEFLKGVNSALLINATDSAFTIPFILVQNIVLAIVQKLPPHSDLFLAGTYTHDMLMKSMTHDDGEDAGDGRVGDITGQAMPIEFTISPVTGVSLHNVPYIKVNNINVAQRVLSKIGERSLMLNSSNSAFLLTSLLLRQIKNNDVVVSSLLIVDAGIDTNNFNAILSRSPQTPFRLFSGILGTATFTVTVFIISGRDRNITHILNTQHKLASIANKPTHVGSLRRYCELACAELQLYLSEKGGPADDVGDTEATKRSKLQSIQVRDERGNHSSSINTDNKNNEKTNKDTADDIVCVVDKKMKRLRDNVALAERILRNPKQFVPGNFVGSLLSSSYPRATENVPPQTKHGVSRKNMAELLALLASPTRPHKALAHGKPVTQPPNSMPFPLAASTTQNNSALHTDGDEGSVDKSKAPNYKDVPLVERTPHSSALPEATPSSYQQPLLSLALSSPIISALGEKICATGVSASLNKSAPPALVPPVVQSCPAIVATESIGSRTNTEVLESAAAAAPPVPVTLPCGPVVTVARSSSHPESHTNKHFRTCKGTATADAAHARQDAKEQDNNVLEEPRQQKIIQKGRKRSSSAHSAKHGSALPSVVLQKQGSVPYSTLDPSKATNNASTNPLPLGVLPSSAAATNSANATNNSAAVASLLGNRNNGNSNNGKTSLFQHVQLTAGQLPPSPPPSALCTARGPQLPGSAKLSADGAPAWPSMSDMKARLPMVSNTQPFTTMPVPPTPQERTRPCVPIPQPPSRSNRAAHASGVSPLSQQQQEQQQQQQHHQQQHQHSNRHNMHKINTVATGVIAVGSTAAAAAPAENHMSAVGSHGTTEMRKPEGMNRENANLRSKEIQERQHVLPSTAVHVSTNVRTVVLLDAKCCDTSNVTHDNNTVIAMTEDDFEEYDVNEVLEMGGAACVYDASSSSSSNPPNFSHGPNSLVHTHHHHQLKTTGASNRSATRSHPACLPSRVLSELCDTVLRGCNAAILAAHSRTSPHMTTQVACDVVRRLYERMRRVGDSIATHTHPDASLTEWTSDPALPQGGMTVSIVKLKGEMVIDLLDPQSSSSSGTATSSKEQKLFIGISPIFGSCVHGVRYEPIDKPHSFDRMLNSALQEAGGTAGSRDYGLVFCCILVKLKPVHTEDVLVCSLTISLAGENVGLYSAVLNQSPLVPRALYHYALGGSCLTVALLAIDGTERRAHQMLQVQKCLGQVSNRPTHPGSVVKLINGVRNDLMPTLYDKLRSSSTDRSEHDTTQAILDRLSELVYDAEQLLSDFEHNEPKAYIHTDISHKSTEAAPSSVSSTNNDTVAHTPSSTLCTAETVTKSYITPISSDKGSAKYCASIDAEDDINSNKNSDDSNSIKVMKASSVCNDAPSATGIRSQQSQTQALRQQQQRKQNQRSKVKVETDMIASRDDDGSISTPAAALVFSSTMTEPTCEERVRSLVCFEQRLLGGGSVVVQGSRVFVRTPHGGLRFDSDEVITHHGDTSTAINSYTLNNLVAKFTQGCNTGLLAADSNNCTFTPFVLRRVARCVLQVLNSSIGGSSASATACHSAPSSDRDNRHHQHQQHHQLPVECGDAPGEGAAEMPPTGEASHAGDATSCDKSKSNNKISTPRVRRKIVKAELNVSIALLKDHFAIDLLSENADTVRQPFRMRFSPLIGPHIAGLSSHLIAIAEDFDRLLAFAIDNADAALQIDDPGMLVVSFALQQCVGGREMDVLVSSCICVAVFEGVHHYSNVLEGNRSEPLELFKYLLNAPVHTVAMLGICDADEDPSGLLNVLCKLSHISNREVAPNSIRQLTTELRNGIDVLKQRLATTNDTHEVDVMKTHLHMVTKLLKEAEQLLCYLSLHKEEDQRFIPLGASQLSNLKSLS